MIQPNEPVIQALRQDIVELKAALADLRKDLDTVNASVQQAFEGMARGTGMSLKFLDARVDDLERRLDETIKT